MEYSAFLLYIISTTAIGMEKLLLTVSDYHEEARKRLDPAAYEYYASGARGEVTLSENENAFKRIFLVPRVLRDVSRVDTSVRILGENFSCPIFVAATAMHKLASIGTQKAISNSLTIIFARIWAKSRLELKEVF